MATPWGIEFNKNVGELFGDARKVIVSQNKNIAFFSITRRQSNE